ncbi:LacI family DNA-binding transcriptional regulator [Paenarthrobacter ureafaciens]|uniref:LacI family DNA-binding transcriptional regulator n=1 Tax=Paenarthrobacter ureafaciens TaxID=37931 RepID=UPI002DB7F1F3|nr:LacI family DNA-binding transcriptional regulator [Paenarthrobacter ureafaciens]MEC3853144.1 LacI family DNA-binding transcriptional regulator [Paenarthrobacter ureafaciens]
MTQQVSRSEKNVTIADVAARSGVSRAAVSKVFNGRGGISVATEARIRKAAEDLGWTRSSAAFALRSSKSMAVGLILNTAVADPDAIPMTPQVLLGIEQVIAKLGYGLLLHVFSDNPEDENQAYRRLAADKRVDGVLLTNARIDDARFKLLADLGLPAVLIGSPPPGLSFPHVDNTPPGAGVDESVRHLVELGHRKIAYIGGPNSRVQPKIRAEAFLESMASAGLQPTATVSIGSTAEMAVTATKQVMCQPEPPTALIFGGDVMAMAAMHYLRGTGLDIPGDVSVVGFDDQPVAEYMNPGLTTVTRNSTQRGMHAAIQLLRILGLDLPDPGPLDRPRLIVRGSTGPAADR